MPRVAGQIDQAKRAAVLDAASAVMGEKGLSASMEEIARRAGVSKQTIYNHYGCKARLIVALTDRRVHELTAPLAAPEAADQPEEALAAFSEALLTASVSPARTAFMRLVIEGASDLPDVARALYAAGHQATRSRLADFLRQEHAAGRLTVADPARAAEFFIGMTMGSYQTAGLLGVERPLSEAQVAEIARDAAARFVRAYAV